MKVFLAGIGDSELVAMLRKRADSCQEHELTALAGDADLVLLAGSFGQKPELLLHNPWYRQAPDKCAVYTEDDSYLPLAPGVYCSAHLDDNHSIGRTFSYTYVSRNGQYKNTYLAETGAQDASRVEPNGNDKRYLFSFQGASTSLLRKRLFRMDFGRKDILIENTSSYFHWDNQPDRMTRQQSYAETLAASNFVLCPRGAGVGTIRLFEVMASGIAPVLLSDEYALPPGPSWDEFLLRIPERKIKHLPAILEAEISSAAERGRLAAEAFSQYFSTAQEFKEIVDSAARSLQHGGASEAVFRRRQRSMIRTFQFKQQARDVARTAFMKGLKLLGLKNPYQLNR